MFALMNLDDDHRAVLSFAAGQERFAELLETDGVFPAHTWLAPTGWPSGTGGSCAAATWKSISSWLIA